MALKPDGADWTIKEQIVEDPASGLTFQFEVMPESTARFRLRVFGDALPFGNRQILFGVSGAEAGAETACALCKPAWLGPID